MPGTVNLHRVYACSPAKLYRALIEPHALAKWMPPYGFYAQVHHSEARVGGTFRMSFVNMTTGKVESFGGRYLEMEENRRLRYTDAFDDPALPGELMVTVELKAVSAGTEIRIVQEGIPDVIPVDACYMGWQQSLAQLALLVEPDIAS